jgi:hypothetical protein
MLFLVAAPAGAVPVVTIDSPAEGALISRGAGPVEAAGEAFFDEPAQSNVYYHLRTQTCSGMEIVGRGLTLEDPPTDTRDACLWPLGYTPANEVVRSAEVYPALDGVPFTLDASRPIIGDLVVRSYPIPFTLEHAGAGITTVDLTVRAASSELSLREVGSTSHTYTTLPFDPPHRVEWSINPSAEFDRQDITAFELAVTIRGVNLLHGFVRYNGASHVTVPSWSSSFGRAIQVAVDGGSFTATGVELWPDSGRWTATIPAPGVDGAHTLRVRAVQGNRLSDEVTRTFVMNS